MSTEDLESPYATADDLLVKEFAEKDLDLSGNRKIRLRGMSRQELFFNGKGTEDPAVVETRNLVSCLLRPVLSRDQAEAFMRSMSAGDGHLISQTIRQLSGLGEGADKSAVAEIRD